MVMWASYSVENDKAFKKALDDALAKVNDLRIPFRFIVDDFYTSQYAIFKLSGPGQYPDLGGLHPTQEKTEKARAAKQKRAGLVYPLLLGKKGNLMQSTISNQHPDSICKIDKRLLIIGTRTPYGIYHQSDRPRKKMPLRKFLFIGPEASRYATDRQMGRLQRWVKIIQDHVIEATKPIAEGAT